MVNFGEWLGLAMYSYPLGYVFLHSLPSLSIPSLSLYLFLLLLSPHLKFPFLLIGIIRLSFNLFSTFLTLLKCMALIIKSPLCASSFPSAPCSRCAHSLLYGFLPLPLCRLLASRNLLAAAVACVALWWAAARPISAEAFMCGCGAAEGW